MMVLNSTDLKDDNNALYLARRPGTRPTFWYTVKDLGATFGETGRFSPEARRHRVVREAGLPQGALGAVRRIRVQGAYTQELLDVLDCTGRHLRRAVDASAGGLQRLTDASQV